jgi:hypothetical protein
MPALQEQSHEFKPYYCQKKEKRKMEKTKKQNNQRDEHKANWYSIK